MRPLDAQGVKDADGMSGPGRQVVGDVRWSVGEPEADDVRRDDLEMLGQAGDGQPPVGPGSHPWPGPVQQEERVPCAVHVDVGRDPMGHDRLTELG